MMISNLSYFQSAPLWVIVDSPPHTLAPDPFPQVYGGLDAIASARSSVDSWDGMSVEGSEASLSMFAPGGVKPPSAGGYGGWREGRTGGSIKGRNSPGTLLPTPRFAFSRARPWDPTL